MVVATVSFDLENTGFMWCLAITSVFFFVPLGIFLIRWGWQDIKQAGRHERFDLDRLSSTGQTEKLDRHLKRHRKKRRRGQKTLVLGIVVALLLFVCGIGIPIEHPHHLHVTEEAVILDYRWPRSDRHIPWSELASVATFSTPGRGIRRRGADFWMELELKDGQQIRVDGNGRAFVVALKDAEQAIDKQLRGMPDGG